MANTIKIKQSATASNVPTAGQLVQGELAINVADRKLYSKDATTVFELTYTHPSDGGGNQTTLTGADVYSDITINSAGHVTNTTVRAMSINDLGGPYDNYASWTVRADSGTDQPISSGEILDLAGGTGITTSNALGTLTITNSSPNTATNLSVGTVTATNVPILSSDGGDITTLPAATGSLAGILTAGAQTIGGTKTFSSTITGSVSGNAGSVTNGVYTSRTISTSAPLTGGGDLSANRTIAIPAATTATSGYLTSADWNTFNNKTSNTGTVTSVAAGDGLSFTTITGSGSVTMGTPSTLTAATSNAVTATSHTHAITGFSETGHTHTDVYTPYDDFRSLGTGAFTTGTSGFITTDELVAELESDGIFDSYSGATKTSWSYAGNDNLSDAGNFTETAGTSWLTWTDNSSDSVRGNITMLAVAPNTGGSAYGVFLYNDQGSTYSPGWRELWNNKTLGTKAQFNTACTDGTFLFSGDVTSDTGVPAMLSSGGLPVLNTGITAAEYRSAIGAGTSSTTGTVTSVSGTGTVSGLTLSGTVTSSGSLTLGGTLSVAAADIATGNLANGVKSYFGSTGLSGSYRVPFTDAGVNTAGNYNMNIDSAGNFHYNPSTNVLTAGTFSGQLAASDVASGSLGSGVQPYVTASGSANLYRVVFCNSTVNTSGNRLLYQSDDGNLYYKSSTGTLYAGIFQVVSDSRKKDEIKTFDGAAAPDIRTVSYRLKKSGIRSVGYIAQEVQAHYPDMVEEDGEGMLTMDISAVQAVKIAKLEAQVKDLTEKLEAVMKML